jgi:hypothetical protein
MWTAAAHLTELVARYRGLCAKAAHRSNRVLSDAHFMFRGGGERKTGRIRQSELELARQRDARSRLTVPSPEARHLDQVILELERKVLEAQHDRGQATAELADEERQLSDRRIAVLRAPRAGAQK